MAEEALSKVDTHDLKLISTSQSNMLMKLSFCPQKILLIRPLAKSFPVMGYGVGAHCMVVVESMVVEPGLKYLNMYVRCCYLYFVYIKFMFTNLPALHRP